MCLLGATTVGVGVGGGSYFLVDLDKKGGYSNLFKVSKDM